MSRFSSFQSISPLTDQFTILISHSSTVFVKYSPKIKAVALKLLIQGKSLQTVNKLIETNISTKSLRQWKDLWTRTNQFMRDVLLYLPRGRPLAITVEEWKFVLDLIDKDPTIYLNKIQKAIMEASGEFFPLSTISDDLKQRLGLTRKVAWHVNSAQCHVKRALWSQEIADMPANYLVFVDELAVCVETQHRRMGQSACGWPTNRVKRQSGTICFSMLPGVSTDGVVAVTAQQGSIQRLDFDYFLEYVLIPFMNPFPGPRSLIVMDNCRIHHGGRIAQICKQHHIIHMYLPPYSPNFNPIEKAFAVIKSDLKRTQPLTDSANDSNVIREKVSDVFTPKLMQALPKDCTRDYSPQSAQLVKKLKQAREKKTCALHLKCVLSLAKASIALGDTACRPEIVDAEEAMALFVTLCHPCTFDQDNSNFI
ncbi:hypothetical protein PCANC_27680 [Puccinia coronata f. sp. avenae]|uniref:Tc1-like transposase DDE domain-containing protein n=1 Tax=Puccinia coronata f. sp. avenae TaxID=200324 RepID=A0A2N5THZ8_9BASI|nr:hypothetical protein PCANC_27680 [Puccinia coronata f. sp. avenae]